MSFILPITKQGPTPLLWLALALLALKATLMPALSWWIVTLPLWGPYAAIIAIALAISIAIGLIFAVAVTVALLNEDN